MPCHAACIYIAIFAGPTQLMSTSDVKVVTGNYIANKIAESTGLNPTGVKRMFFALRTITYAELRKKGKITIPGVHLKLRKVGNITTPGVLPLV